MARGFQRFPSRPAPEDQSDLHASLIATYLSYRFLRDVLFILGWNHWAKDASCVFASIPPSPDRVPGMSTRNDKPPSRGLLDFTCPSTSCRHPVCADYFSLNISIQSHSVGSNPVGRQLSFFLDNVSITASYVVMSRLLLLFFLSSCVSILYSCFSPLTRQPVSRWRLISDRFLSVTLFVESLDAPQGRLPSINYLPGNLLSSLLFQCQSSMHAVDVC